MLYIHTVEFDAWPYRRAGTLIPRWQRSTQVVRGYLVVDEVHDADLQRMVRVAHLFDHQRMDLLPPLHDVVLIACKPDHWTFTGYERQPSKAGVDQVCYQQSWMLTPASFTDAERARSKLPPPLPPIGRASP